jgi:hypothetical protein
MMNAAEFPDVGDAVSLEERSLALRLAPLHPDDRRWLLERLPENARARLDGLLAELGGLGIAVDAAVARDFAARNRSTPALAEDHVLNPDERVIETAAPEQITRLLNTEPPAVRRALMSMRTWSWSAAVSPSRSERDAPDFDRPTLTLRARESLMRAVADVLPEAVPERTLQPVRHTGALQRFIARWSGR